MFPQGFSQFTWRVYIRRRILAKLRECRFFTVYLTKNKETEYPFAAIATTVGDCAELSYRAETTLFVYPPIRRFDISTLAGHCDRGRQTTL